MIDRLLAAEAFLEALQQPQCPYRAVGSLRMAAKVGGRRELLARNAEDGGCIARRDDGVTAEAVAKVTLVAIVADAGESNDTFATVVGLGRHQIVRERDAVDG